MPGFMQQDLLPVQSEQAGQEPAPEALEGERAEAIPWASAGQGCFAHSHSPRGEG